MSGWRALAVLLAAMAYSSCAAAAERAAPHPALRELAPGQWTKIHEQKPDDPVRFRRQWHGGAAFDSRRGRIVLFGSDEHGEDWTNAPLFFDLATLSWSRPYEDSDPATYRVDARGIPVAGPNGDRPWAMHTFGAVVYHEKEDALVVSSVPEHLSPGRFTDAMAHVWAQIRRHPTWVLSMATGTWTPRDAGGEHFFPYATAYDPSRHVVIGYKAAGVFELWPRPTGWRRVAAPGLLGFHNNAAFDTRHNALVVFGSDENSDAVVVYRPETGTHLRMPTPGLRPPKSQHRPMAFHARLGRTVVLFDHVDRRGGGPGGATEWADTWLYDLGADAWTRLASASLPFRLLMNYNLVYDSADTLLLLVANAPDQPTAVWALRL